MPPLAFEITGVEAVARGLTPLLQFKVAVTHSGAEPIHSILLHTQIQIQAPNRPYSAHEKQNLVELYGPPERWGQTLRNRLWTTADTTISGSAGRATALFSIPCTYDLSLAATKYFYGLEAGEIPLLFLFSGTIFYGDESGRLQARPISWDSEAQFRLPLSQWKNLMEHHFPNSAWLYLRRDVFDRLYACKRANGDATWEQTLERLLAQTPEAGTGRTPPPLGQSGPSPTPRENQPQSSEVLA